LLLFSIEPLIGRLLTPYFGSAPHVWLVCLMFFQALLFLGYLYSHLWARKIGRWHLILLALPLVNLPPQINAIPDPQPPLLSIISTLTLGIALPFLVLSTTAVVAQIWQSHSPLMRGRNPYPLYAASNAGSLIALLGYAFIAEPLMGVRMQGIIWSGAYIFYMFFVVGSWFLLAPGKKIVPDENGETPPVPAIAPGTYAKWMLLSFLPSVYLLAVTNFISLEMGSFPLTWILPLALYLGSFIITFREKGGVPGAIKNLWPEMLLAGGLMFLLGSTHWLFIFGHLAVFFLICLVSHGTLYELRPLPAGLTNFYLSLALGGWIGGAAVSLAAPHLFKGLYEYPLALCLFGLLFFFTRPGSFKTFLPGAPVKIFCLRWTVSLFLVAVVLMGTKTAFDNHLLFQHRNFFGTYRIKDFSSPDKQTPAMRKFIHGRTVHGAQFLDAARELEPLVYYYEGGAIAQAFHAKSPRRCMANVGLGAGVAAAFAVRGDKVTYYEIDPDNEGIARRWFSFLDKCRGRVRVQVGDARLSIRQAAGTDPKYDMIFIDAFTGDGIPTHLITKEAIETYLSRLNDDGVILFHVSNRYYDLRPVIKATAESAGLRAAANIPAAKKNLSSSDISPCCVVAARDAGTLKPFLELGWVWFSDKRFRESAAWTDDYINILDPLMEKIRLK